MSELLSQSESERFIADHYGPRASSLEPIAAGEWSRPYALTLDGQEAVVRFGIHGEDFAKDQVMGQMSAANLPIPKVIELGVTPGGYFVVSERVHGTLIDDLDGPGMKAALPALLTALDAIRDIDVSDRTGFGGWNSEGVAPHHTWQDALLSRANDRPGDRTHGWRAALESSPTGAKPFDIAFARFKDLVDQMPSERHIIHNDLLSHNALVDGDRVSAIIDWGNSMYGDYLYDAAWLTYWWQWYPKWADIDIRAELVKHWEQTGNLPANFEERLRCYEIHIGLDAQAYNAFTNRWDELQSNAERTLELSSPQ